MFEEYLKDAVQTNRVGDRDPTKTPYFFLYLEFFEFMKSMIDRYVFDFDDFTKCFTNSSKPEYD